MALLTRKFPDGSFLEYDSGKFDDWCIYLTCPNTKRFAPRDWQYFIRISKYGKIYGNEKLYKDFVAIYNATGKNIDQNTFGLIDTLSQSYGEDSLGFSIVFSIIYMGMIAEENKRNSRLGKRIKHLGVYQVLMEGIPGKKAANYTRGMNWQDIDKLCKEKGF